MRAKRIIIALMISVFILLMPVCLCYAEAGEQGTARVSDPRDTLSVITSISPKGMAVPQEAHVYITLANSATAPISDIRILDSAGTILEEMGDLSGTGRSSVQFEDRLTPTAKQWMAEGIEYQIQYTIDKGLPTELRSKITELVPIDRLTAEPGIELTRTPSANFAQAGDSVTLTYRLRNTGNVPLTELVISDDATGEVGTLDQLSPGKKYTFTINATIDENLQSRPRVSYTYPGHDERIEQKIEALTIYMADEKLEARLDADQTSILPGGVVNLQLKITNNGNVTYNKLEIKDEALGTFGPIPVELRPGQDYWFAKRVNIKSTTNFLFTITGRSSSAGEAVAASNMLTVAVTPPVGSIKLEITARADGASLPEAGPMPFTINLKNSGDMDVRNVVLSESARGEIKSLAVVPIGETAVPVQYDIAGAESFHFLATMRDAQGASTTVFAQPIEVKIVPKSAPVLNITPIPSSTAILGIDDTAYRVQGDTDSMFMRMMMTALMILGALSLMLLVSTLVRYSKRRKMKRITGKRLRLKKNLQRTGRTPKVSDNTGVYKKADLAANKEGQ